MFEIATVSTCILFPGWGFKKSTAFGLGKLITGLTKTKNSVSLKTPPRKKCASYDNSNLSLIPYGQSYPGNKKLQVPSSKWGDGIIS